MFKAAVSLADIDNITAGGQSIGYRVIDTDGDALTALEQTCLTVSAKNVVGLVGPSIPNDAYDIARFARRIGIPVVSYSATDPDLSDRHTYPTFYRTIPSDKSAVVAIAKLFQRFNWTSCVLFYQNDAFGLAGVRALNQAFERYALKMREVIVFDIDNTIVRDDLSRRLLESTTRVIVLWADSTHTSRIVQEAANSDVLGPKFLWILRTSIPLAGFNDTLAERAVGMLSVEPVSGDRIGAPANGSLLSAAYEIWQRYEPDSFPGANNVDPHALFAFDATWLLIQSLQSLSTQEMDTLPHLCLPSGSSSLHPHRPASNSTSLLEHISATNFLGVSGPVEYRNHRTDRTDGIHYVTHNARTSPKGLDFVPTLAYSEPGSWQSIQASHEVLWPGKSSKVPSDRAAISSVKLRIGVYGSAPFTMRKYQVDEHGQNQSRLVGYIPDLIELLRKKMNFVPQLVTSSNHSYASLIQAVARKDLDMFIGDTTVTSTRRNLVAFSVAIFDNALQLLVRKPTIDQVDLFSFLKPFSFRLWMIIVTTMTFTSLLIFIVERHDNGALRDRSILSIGAMSFWYSFGNIMGYGADFHAATISGRIITIALYILSLVLVASYTANLASNLTISKTKYIINSIDDIREGKLPLNRIGVRVGTRAEEFALREISDGSQNFYTFESGRVAINRLLRGDIDTIITDSGTGQYIANYIYCNLSVVGTHFDTGAFGIVFPKDWLYIGDFDVNILALRESGELDKLRRRWFETSTCDETVRAPNAMGVDSMFGLLLTVGIIVFVAILTLAWTKRMAIQNSLQTIQGRG